MSSGFVSGGTADAPTERSDAWLAAQREIEANIQRKAIEARQQTDGRSLFETLEANKAAKQDAFEEANRLKNQFRALDQDEVDYLDSVLESTRAEEARVKKETAEGLALFRQQQEQADKKARGEGEATANADEGSPVREEESWVAGGRKRKRTKDKEGLKGVKIRKASSSGAADAGQNESHKESPSAKSTITRSSDGQTPTSEATGTKELESPKPSSGAKQTSAKAAAPSSAGPGKGLVSYGSDDDDDW